MADSIRKDRQEQLGSCLYLPLRGAACAPVGTDSEQAVVNILARECLEAEGRNDVAV